MAINNLNPRRTVWFSPNEPSNKYDIWLSRNAHLDENGEPTTDSNSQRDCDYIFKIYDCGKWNPIVGFNTTAANKIDTVTGVDYTIDGVTHTGKNLYHPAIFTAESPNELYDAGSLGSLLSDTNFVTELEWHNVFNSSNYDWGDIFGDTTWFGDLTWSIIQGGSSSYQLPRAQPNRLGGICANTFDTIAANGFAECKFYNSTDNKLYVSGTDILTAISESQGGSVDPSVLYRSFYNSPTILKGWTDDPLTALKPRFELSGSRVVENRGKIPMLRNDNWWETHGSGYAGDYDDTNSALVWVDLGEIIPDLVNDEDIFVPKDGINISYVAPHDNNRQYVEWGLNHIEEATDGQYCRKITDNGVADIEWVDLPTGTAYTPGTGIAISQLNEISIDTTGASTGQVLTKTANGVDWETPLQGTTYTAGIGINIQSNKISQNIIKAIPEATGTITEIRIDWASAKDKFTVTYGVGYSEDVELYEVIDFADVLSLNSEVGYSITLIPFNTNPSYFILRNIKSITVAQDLEFINMPSSFSDIRGVLVTILFGIVKFEVIEISQTTSNVESN